jgi:hypothetical protein
MPKVELAGLTTLPMDEQKLLAVAKQGIILN